MGSPVSDEPAYLCRQFRGTLSNIPGLWACALLFLIDMKEFTLTVRVICPVLSSLVGALHFKTAEYVRPV